MKFKANNRSNRLTMHTWVQQTLCDNSREYRTLWGCHRADSPGWKNQQLKCGQEKN